MRELKFRVWFEPTDQYKKEEIELGRQMPDDIYACFYTSDDFFDDTWCNLADYKNEPIIEQYTGLKDKNGAEIYEGDIIEVETATFYDPEVSRYEVYWNEDMLDDSLRLISGINFDDCVGELSPSAVSIIGNIHENPELLKGD